MGANSVHALRYATMFITLAVRPKRPTRRETLFILPAPAHPSWSKHRFRWSVRQHSSYRGDRCCPPAISPPRADRPRVSSPRL